MRSAFALLGAALSAASVVRADDLVYVQSAEYVAGDLGPTPLQEFVSSDLTPPALNFIEGYQASVEGTTTNYTMLSYRGGEAPDAPPMPVILDNNGSLIWAGPEYGASMDLRVQMYNDEPVLTFYQGSFFSVGMGMGSWYILDQQYNVISTVSSVGQPANQSDFHDFIITPDNTALLMSWRPTQTDLSAIAGPADGWTYDCVFQEIDIASRELIFEWKSLDHVPVENTYYAPGGRNSDGSTEDAPFDYCHMNSIKKDSAGNYITSMRGPSAVYYIDGESGELLWTLSGKNSSFEMQDGATFWYQHDAHVLGDAEANPLRVSIFDNGAEASGDAPAEPMRGIILSLDTDAMTASLEQEYLPTVGGYAQSQGGMDVLDDGQVFIGWGSEPYFGMYQEDGTLMYEAQFGTGSSDVQSYRAHHQVWIGAPTTPPSFVVQGMAMDGGNDTSGLTGFVSWNGATEVETWVLLGSTTTAAPGQNLRELGRTQRMGFESNFTIDANNGETFFAVAAYDADDGCLGVSEMLDVSGGNATSTGVMGACPNGAPTVTPSAELPEPTESGGGDSDGGDSGSGGDNGDSGDSGSGGENAGANLVPSAMLAIAGGLAGVAATLLAL